MAMTSLPLSVKLDLDLVKALKQLCEEYPKQLILTTSLGIDYQALTDLITINNGRRTPKSRSFVVGKLISRVRTTQRLTRATLT